MQYELDDEYLEDARRRAYRFQGQWCGTSGSLAADVARLLKERTRMTEMIATLEDANAKLRAAVGERLAGTPADDPKMAGYVPAAESCCDGGKCHAKPSEEPPQDIPVDWILQGQREMDAHRDDVRWTGDSILAEKADVTPAEKLLMDALDVVRDRRPKYGGPRHHFRRTVGMINAAFADVLNRPLTESDWAIFMTFDKVARFLGPNKTADGPIDLAGYAACLAECESAEPV
jgi:hypothetical protein